MSSSSSRHEREKSMEGLLPTPTSSGSSSPANRFGNSFSLSRLKNLRHLPAKALQRYIALLALALASLVVLGKLAHSHSDKLVSVFGPGKKTYRLSTPQRPPNGVNLITGGLREIDISSKPLPLSASLETRLQAWTDAPGGRGEIEGEYELGGMYWINQESCVNSWPNYNNDLEQRGRILWNSLNRSSIHGHRMRLINQLSDVHVRGDTKKWGEGRGIVFTAGNADTLQRVIYTLRMLRHRYNSTLPAQIYHFPDEKPPQGSPLVEEARSLGAELIEAKGGAKKDTGRTKNYHLKAIAIVQCPWREVLYLDSDNVPTRDPEFMFEATPYKRLRAMFWPDYWKTSSSNPIWAILGVRCRDEWEMEAGQILIDKKYHLDAMLLSQHMLEDFHFWFQFSDGDKDIFRFAFLALRKRWALPGRYVGVGGLPTGTSTGNFCGLTMMQYDHLGEPLFVHYNLLKQVPSGVGRGYSWGRTKQMPSFLFPHGSPLEPSGHNRTLFDYYNNLVPSTEEPEDDDFKTMRDFGNVDCDMLADADDEGYARAPASEAVRRRAGTERGARAGFHGGWSSPLCVDTRYDDPRPEEIRELVSQLRDKEEERLREMWRAQGIPDDERGPEQNMAGENELGIKYDNGANWDVVLWEDDPLLKDFENNIYDEGFIPNGQGF